MIAQALKTTFSRGELTPKAHARVDLELYAGGAEKLLNWIPIAEGGIARRPGSRYAGTVKQQNKPTRLIPFIYSSSQSYVIELGDGYMRFWSAGEQIKDGTQVVEIASPYTLTEIWHVQFVQSGNVLFLAHGNHRPRMLTRNSQVSWVLSIVDFIDGPFLQVNDTDTSLSSGAALKEGTTTTVTASSTWGINNNQGFLPTDVGRHIRMKATGDPQLWVYGTIQSRSSPTEITVLWRRVGTGITKEDDVTSGGTSSNTKNWRLGAFSDTTGWPSAVQIYDGRLVWGRTSSATRSMWFSRSGLPFDYSPSHGNGTVDAYHGFMLTLMAGRGDEILWMADSSRMMVGTSGSIRSVGATETEEAISPDNASLKLAAQYGVEDIMPVQVGSHLLVSGRLGRTVRDVYFNYELNGMMAENISRLSSHLFRESIADIAYAQEPNSIVWFRTIAGKLVSCTYDRPERIIAFAPHDIGGIIESLTVIPGAAYDELWMTVRRTINGEDKRYVEYLSNVFEGDLLEDAFQVDCGITYDGAPTNVVSAVGHLEGQTVNVLADGVAYTRLKVTNGKVTLPNGVMAAKWQIGLPMVSECRLLRPPVRTETSIMVSPRQQAIRAHVEVIDTLGLKAGTANMKTLEKVIKNATKLQTGKYRVNLEDRWDNGARIVLRIDEPYPAYVRAVITDFEVEDV